MSGQLVVAVPSKGALHQPTLDLLERCFLKATRDAGGRSYNGRLSGVPGAAVLYARADEIPEIVATGRAQIGFTGLDLVLESRADDAGADDPVRLLIDDLGYGGAALEVGVPRSWIDVRRFADLVEVGHDIRHQHARPMLVASKFINLTRRHFLANGLTDFRIVDSLGATEAAPRSGTADIVVDLVSSGATFDANGLTKIEGGKVLQSQGCLVAAADRDLWSDTMIEQFQYVGELVEAALRAASLRTLRAVFTGPFDGLEPELEGLLDDIQVFRSEQGRCELTASFDSGHVHQVLAATRSAGAVQANVVRSDIMASWGSPRIADFVAELRV